MKVLMKIAEVYSVENTLKDMTAEDRLAVRIEKEKPLMDELFDYIEALDKDDNTYSYRLQKAITYALNQKEHLLRYLEDGNIPIDDGNTERSLKGYCTGRRNWLFYDTVDGAEASAIIYTMVETARLNGVDARMYLQYLLEKMSAHKNEEHSSEFLDTMMPWSDEFSEYETDKKKEAMVLMEDFFRKPEKRREDVPHLIGKQHVVNQPVVERSDQKAFRCQLKAIIFVDFFIAVHPAAAVNIENHGELSGRPLGIINIEQMSFFAVMDVRKIGNLPDPGRRCLRVDPLLIGFPDGVPVELENGFDDVQDGIPPVVMLWANLFHSSNQSIK